MMIMSNNLPLVYDNIIATVSPPEGDIHLQGGYCASCGQYHFPIADNCPNCFGDVERANLGRDAQIHSVSTIRTKAPLGLPSPYSVAYVDMKDVPLRLFALMAPEEAGHYQIGQSVELVVAPLGVNNQDEPCLRPYFRAAK